jgi:hypothetical protein
MKNTGILNPEFDPLKLSENFEDLNPFSKKDIPIPQMPISGFPLDIQNFINECSHVYGTNRDLWTGAVLSAVSTAIGQSVILKTKFENPPLLWITVISGSGLGKSEPFHLAYKPIVRRDNEYLNQFQADIAQYEIDLQIAKDKKLEKPSKPICKQSITVDSTPEKLAKIMSDNKRGIVIMRDELSGWFKDFGRYARSGEQQTMLSYWSQSPIRVDRVNSFPYLIEKPFCNVCGGIQPALLPEMANDNRDVNGFLPRFCFVYPDHMEAPFYSSDELSELSLSNYNSFIYRLLDVSGYRGAFCLSSEAESLYKEFFNKNASLTKSNQSDYLNEVNSKLNIIVLRLAILFHVSNESVHSVQALTMSNAIEMAEYFRLTQNKVWTKINSNTIDSKILIKYLFGLGNTQTDIGRILKCTPQYVSKVLSCK